MMKPRNYSLIFFTLLFANVTTTAIAGTLIYGMLTGLLPGPAGPREAVALPAAPGADRLYGAGMTRPEPAKQAVLAGAGTGGEVLLCQRLPAGADPAGKAVTPGANPSPLPLVDKRSRKAESAGEPFFF